MYKNMNFVGVERNERVGGSLFVNIAKIIKV